MSQQQRAVGVEELFPQGARAYEFCGLASPNDLLPMERRCVSRAVEARVLEYAAGRVCARAAITSLGHPVAPILSASDRSPIWPSGVVGSITHTGQYCVAVVGSDRQFTAIGVDAERLGAVDPPLWELTFHPDEVASLRRLDQAASAERATMLFAAKEAFYKCQYGITRSWIGFQDVIVTITGTNFDLSFTDEPKLPLQLAGRWKGRLAVVGDLVIAGISVLRPSALE